MGSSAASSDFVTNDMPNKAPIVANDSAILATASSVQEIRHLAAVNFYLVPGFVLLMTLTAQVRVPVPGTDVPMTLQLLGVLLGGLLLSPSQAAAALSAYLVLGSAGLPVFAPGSTGLWGPTGGYLVGFIPAACLMGVVRGRSGAGVSRLMAAGFVGVVVVFVCGIGWRTVWLAGEWRLALLTGLLPFAIKAMVELCLAVALVVTVRRWQGHRAGANVSEYVG